MGGVAVALAALLLGVPLARGGEQTPGRSSSQPLAAARGIVGTSRSAAAYVPGVVLLGFHSGVSAGQQSAIELAAGGKGARRLGPRIKPVDSGHVISQEVLEPMVLRVPEAQELTVVSKLEQDPAVAYAEPDYLEKASALPNDPEFGKQWGDENTGQLIPFQDQEEKLGAEEKGTPGADDRATQAWNVTTGSRSIVIGEVDTGVSYEHPDLAANIWSNPGGINGCAAGTHGYNVLAKTCNPIDEDTSYNGHGTHVAGILGAVGNNGTGVAGMNWQTTILPVRWMDNGNSGATSALIEALQWLVAAKQAGVNVRVANDSDVFFGSAKSEALSNEIETLGANEILFVTAAGNGGQNIDTSPQYPCSYERPTEICVTASNHNDVLPGWANTGVKAVQLAAPGVSIYSTLRGNSYGWLSGGSMASPQVAGAAALVLSQTPAMTTKEVRTDILSNVDKLPAFEGKVSTGGRLDVCRAVSSSCTVPPPPLTCGKTAVGGSTDSFGFERKRVNSCTLPTSGSVTKLSVYLEPAGTSGQQVMKGVIYSDAAGKPEKLLGVSEQLTFKSTNAGNWYELPFSSPVKLSAGSYWIGVITGATSNVAGFRYDSVTNSRDYNANTYSSGPTNPFGSVTVDNEQTSLYATYTTVPVPTVETKEGSSVTQTTATLNATVNPNGGEVSECKLEYGTTTSYGSSASCTPAPGSGTSPVAVSASVSLLSPNTTYHFRVSATNAGGTSKGTDETLKTLPNAPTLETKAPSAVTQTSATLNATVNPNGGEVSECKLEYGITTSYGSSAACTPAPGSVTSPVAVSASVSPLSPNTTYHFRVVGTNAGGTSKGLDETFKTLPNAPALAECIVKVTQTTATLCAMVNPNGSEVSECKFEYGPTTSYGSSAACTPAPGSGTSPVEVRAEVTGLSPNTTYHLSVSATNAGGNSVGSDRTFKTLPNPPTVVSEPASSVTQTTATLNATVNPNGGEVSECKLEFGTTTAYGSFAPCSPAPGSGESAAAVSGPVSGLLPNTSYHFRIAATNAGGTSVGSDRTFTTLRNPPIVETKAASGVTHTLATLNGSVNPGGGGVSDCHLEYGTSEAYGSTVPCTPSPGSGESPVGVSASVGSLAPNTTYHFRISATNAGGTSKGSDQSFTTIASLPTPHWYRNAAKLPLGEKDGTIGWGTVTLESSAGNVTCRSAQAANVENTEGAARQETVVLVTWECKAIGGKCAGNEARLSAKGLPWIATVLEEGVESTGMYRQEAAGVELDSECYVGGKLTESLAFKTGPVLGETGTWTPKEQNGTSATKPSETLFDSSSGHLYAEAEGKATAGTPKGKVKVVGYQDSAPVPLIALAKP
jgi:subtilisin family serine protease/phosphodiesterase/alkaline phosphatase D-like protein